MKLPSGLREQSTRWVLLRQHGTITTNCMSLVYTKYSSLIMSFDTFKYWNEEEIPKGTVFCFFFIWPMKWHRSYSPLWHYRNNLPDMYFHARPPHDSFTYDWWSSSNLTCLFFFFKCKWRAEALEAIVWLINHCSICHLQMPSRWSGAAKIKLLTNMQVVLWMWPRWQRLCCCRAPLLFCCLWVRRDGRCTVVKCKRIVWQVCTCMCGGERGREEIVAFLRWEIRIISSLFDEI